MLSPVDVHEMDSEEFSDEEGLFDEDPAAEVEVQAAASPSLSSAQAPRAASDRPTAAVLPDKRKSQMLDEDEGFCAETTRAATLLPPTKPWSVSREHFSLDLEEEASEEDTLPDTVPVLDAPVRALRGAHRVSADMLLAG